MTGMNHADISQPDDSHPYASHDSIMGDSFRVRKPVFHPFQTRESSQLREPNGLGRISVFEQFSPGVSNFKNLRKPSVFSPSPSILIDGEGRGGVALSFRDVRGFVDRDVCLRVPLSIILSPRFAGGERKPEVLGWWMRLKWPIPSRFEMVSNQPLHFSSAPPSPAEMRPMGCI